MSPRPFPIDPTYGVTHVRDHSGPLYQLLRADGAHPGGQPLLSLSVRDGAGLGHHDRAAARGARQGGGRGMDQHDRGLARRHQHHYRKAAPLYHHRGRGGAGLACQKDQRRQCSPSEPEHAVPGAERGRQRPPYAHPQRQYRRDVRPVREPLHLPPDSAPADVCGQAYRRDLLVDGQRDPQPL